MPISGWSALGDSQNAAFSLIQEESTYQEAALQWEPQCITWSQKAEGLKHCS